MRTVLFFAGLLFVLIMTNQAFAQKGPDHDRDNTSNEKITIIDRRIDNMEYWMRLASKGMVPYNPAVQIPPAEYKGSAIPGKGLRLPDSPDIPVTTITSVTESENSVFIDPDNNMYLLNSNNSTSWSGGTVGSVYGANYFQSSDAGATYGGITGGAGGENSGDPATAINRAGRQFVNFIDSPGGQGIAYSDDGSTWTTSTIAPNPGSLADKNHMWIDNSTTSPYQGHLYVAWTDFGGTYDYNVVFSRSVDNGVTWSTRVPISGSVATFNHGTNLQTGPNGEVYAIWATYPSSGLTEDGIGFNKSTDGGATFGTATKIISNIKGIRETGVLKSMRVNSFPVMAVDVSNGPNRGNIYAVWTNIGVPGTNSGTNKSVYMIRSSNNGTTWSTPVRVNQGTFADGKESWEPWITCDPETGTVAVIFYDDRNTASTACETWVSYSVDAGNNWTDFRVSDVSFTPTPIPGLASSYMGDYLGITSRGGRVYPCWTDTRGGVFMTYVSPFVIGLNAAFTASATTVCSGTGVTFTDQSSGPPTSWQWTFPGGTPSSFTGQHPPAITYNTPGTYDVTLVVGDGTGTDTETKTGYITVGNVFADFTGAPATVVVTNSVSFTDNSICSPSTWNWSFPGGTPSSYIGQTPPAITYNTLGTYDVSLTVTKSSSSSTKTKTGYITVTPPEFPMSTTTVTTCTGNFYDPGGASGAYSNSQDFTMTFNPGTAGSSLRFVFNSFDLEAQATCGYDYLKIYDGNSTAGTLLGTWCGTTSPGTVTASNATGSLTFVFHSDVSVTGAGWSAAISCITGIVTNPATFTATPASTSQINLAWTKNTNANDVMIAWSPTSTFGTPVDGTVYSAGSSLPGGGTVLYRGSLTAFNHTSLTSNTTYYYNAFSFNAGNSYSAGATANATTMCGISTIPFTENFAASTLPACWTKQITGTGGTDKWTVSNTANAGGAAYEMMSTWQSVNPGTTRLVTPPMNTTGMSALTLNFKHLLDAYAAGCTLHIQSSTNGTTWTNEAWSVISTATNVGPETVNTTVLNNLNSPTTYVAFTIDGDLYQYDYWYVDNISITGAGVSIPTVTTTTPTSITTTTASSGGNVTLDGGGTVSARGVCWGTAANPVVSGNHTTDGSGTGVFSSSITGLTPITGYHERAYATNSAGTAYGSDLPFTSAALTLSVSPSNQGVTTAAGSTSFTVTSNASWTAVSNQSWCTVTPSGSGNGTITASYSQNATYVSRMASITVTVSGLTPVVVTVTQDAAVLPEFLYTITNDVQTSDRTLEFDLYILDPSEGTTFELAAIQAGILVNSGIYNGGTITMSIVPGTSQLNTNQQPASVTFVQTQNCIKLAPKSPPGAGGGTVISSAGQGTRVCRLKLTNSVAFAAAQANLAFSFTTSPYPTKVFQYISGLNTLLTCNSSNCYSTCTNPILLWTNTTVNMSVLLQGLYAGSGTMNAVHDQNGIHWDASIADKITVELHSSSNYATVIYTLSNVDLLTNGTATFSVPGTFTGNYYITVKNRNSITTVTSAPVSFAAGPVSYNFTDNISKAYGNNLLLMIDGKYTIFSGDAYPDDLIDGTDMSNVENAASDFLAGYILTDVNGDGLVDGTDLSIVENNASNFIAVITP